MFPASARARSQQDQKRTYCGCHIRRRAFPRPAARVPEHTGWRRKPSGNLGWVIGGAGTTSVIRLSPLARLCPRGSMDWAPGEGGLAMGVVWYRLRADVRVRWRTLALIAVLVGVGGGVALTAFAGARRTAAAVPKMLAYSRPDDGDVGFGGFCRPPRVTGPAARSLAPLPGAAQVLRLPQVAAFARMPYLFFSASPSGLGLGGVNVTASADVQGFRTIDRPLMVAGRFPERPAPLRCRRQRACGAAVPPARGKPADPVCVLGEAGAGVRPGRGRGQASRTGRPAVHGAGGWDRQDPHRRQRDRAAGRGPGRRLRRARPTCT